MRYLLLISAFLLFLSNIPFVHKMEVKEMGCCKKMKKEMKCMKQETCNICICGFQYAAPDQIGEKIQFGVTINNGELPGYLENHWKDAQLAAPWQPPDVS
jgi:hypothetical protein